MKKLIAKFDKNISIDELDEQIQKLVENFPDRMSILVRCRMTSKHIVAILEENPDLSSVERLEWDLEKMKDKIATWGVTIN
jgi:hypothetical protein